MKKLLSLLLALCMVFALAACGSKPSEPKSDGGGDTTKSVLENQEDASNIVDVDNAKNDYIKDKVTFAYATATSLSPWGTANDIPGNYEVYEMLFECDAKGEMYALLADSSKGEFGGYDHVKGSGVYTIYIYDYITDHNGNHVTAQDVAFSYNYQFKNESTSGWGDMVSVEAKDDTTVVMTFKEDQDGLGELENILCRCFIVDEESFNKSASGLVSDMCGTGPYMFDNYVSGSNLTLKRNADYWQKDELRRQEQQANVETIVYQFIDENAQKVIALKTGAVDIVNQIDAAGAVDFADGGEFADKYNLFTFEAKFVNFLTPNCSEKSICKDPNMRLAIFNAIDQDGLIAALGGTDTRLYAYVSAYYNDFDFVDWKSVESYNTRTAVDTELVKQYLDKAGYNGETLRIMTAGQSDAASVIAAQLAACGIKAEVMSLDFSTARATEADPSAWDLNLGMMAGDYNVTVWQHGFSFQNTAEGDHSGNFVYDKDWNDLLVLCCTPDGHTPENMKAWWEMAVENAYTMGLFTGNNYTVIPQDMTYVCQGDKLTFLPGACTYAAP